MTSAGPTVAGHAPIEHVTLTAAAWTLQPPVAEEASDALALLQDPETARWNPAPRVVDVASAKVWCVSGADWTSGTHATWSVLDVTGRLAGNMSLFAIDTDNQRCARIGYRTAPWARNRGLATEAVRAVTDWAFAELGLERIELVHAEDNDASCAVARKARFVLEGRLRQEYRDEDGHRWDSHLHARLASDRDPSRHARNGAGTELGADPKEVSGNDRGKDPDEVSHPDPDRLTTPS